MALPFPLTTAITALANVTVTGITTSWDLDEIKGKVTASQLPLLMPVLLADQAGEPFVVAAFGGGAEEYSIKFDHVCLYALAGQHPSASWQSIAGQIDNYVDALRNDPYLDYSGSYRVPMGISFAISPARHEWGGDAFDGFTATHTWRFMV